MRFVVLLFVTACGNSTSNNDGGSPAGTVPLGSLDDTCDGVRGLTGRALLAKVGAPVKATFTYFMKGDASAVMPSPFTLDVTYAAGAIVCTPHRNPPPGSDAPSTPATIRVTVVVGFKTDDGVFAETALDGSIDGTPSFVSLSAGELQSAIKGTYEPALTGYAKLSLGVSGSFTDGVAPSGNVSEGGSNGSVGATSPVGSWK